MLVRRLGKIDFQARILGFGAQRVGEPGVEQSTVDRLVAEALDAGVNYIDTAPNYGQSEEVVGKALKGKRDKVFLVTKVETRVREDITNQLRQSMRLLGTDHLDCVHMHNAGRDDRWGSVDGVLAKNGPLGILVDAKKQGMIRHIGVTTHSNPSRILKIVETGEIDLVMGVLNLADRHTYNLEGQLLPELRKRNIAMIAMKVLGGPAGRGPGAMLQAPEDFRASYRYVMGLEGVAVGIIGFRTAEEFRQGLAIAREYKPLSEAEMSAVTERGKALAAKWGPHFGVVT